MNKKHVYTIIAIAVTLSTLSFILLYVQNSSRSLQNNIIGKHLFPDFTDYKVETIEIIKPNGRTTTLKKNKANKWVVANCFDYPADPQKINIFLQELSSMKIIQNVYVDESELSKLNLMSPKSKNVNSCSKITISDNTGKIVFSIIIGVKRSDTIGDNQISRGRYVYNPSTKRTFLVEEPLDEVNYKSRTWLNSKFINIKNIKTVKLLRHDKELWTITRPDINSKFVPATGKKANNDYNTESIDKIISSLENFKFETVANPSFTNVYTGLNNPYIVKVESFDNQTWQIHIGNQSKDTRYVQIVHIDNSKNTKNEIKSNKEWIYLVNQNRISFLIQSEKELLKKSKKTPRIDTYSSPIS